MKKKKYNLNELMNGINENNLHGELLAGESIGKEFPSDKEIITEVEKEKFE